MGLADQVTHGARGDAANASKAYARTRDYCTTNRHVSTCLNVVRVGVEPNQDAQTTRQYAAAGGANAGAATTTTERRL